MTGTKDPGGARILVVRLGAMGDIIHTLPAVASLKHSHPGSRLTWAVERRWAPLLEGNPFVDRVAVVDRASLSSLRASLRELRREPYDFAVDFQGLIKSALVATAAGPRRIFGFHQSQVREKLAAVFYSVKASASAAHVVDRNLELAAAAGAGTAIRAFPLPAGSPQAPLPEGPYVLACPLAGWRSKQWPLEYYAELARLLPAACGATLVVDAPPGADLSSVGEAFRHSSGLPGLIHATRGALAVVGVDSGPLHLAAALGKPGVAIFGPTDPARNGPYGGGITVIRSPAAVTTYKRGSQIDAGMRAVTPAQVLEALKGCLVSL